MRSLPKPTQDVLETFDLCISRVSSVELGQRLGAIRDDVRRAAREYDLLGQAHRFVEIEAHDRVGNVTCAELEGVYTSRMVPKASPGRTVYEQIRGSAPQNICPFCGQRTVGTLDHYLPKSDFPSLAVTPHNLVPSCRDCNSVKRTYVAECELDQLIHPYYDNYTHEQWLFAEVVESAPAAIIYCVRRAGGMSADDFSRIENNFSVLELGELYSDHASAELTNIQFQLEEIFSAAGHEQVRLHLTQAFRSRERAHVNSWQTACYQALCQNDWFCQGGFR